jgi:hypothetical protein
VTFEAQFVLMGREAGVLRYETTWLNKENVKRRPEVKAEVLGADDAAVGVDLKRISVVELADGELQMPNQRTATENSKR